MKFSKTITTKTKQNILNNNGKIISEFTELNQNQIDWNHKQNQTRDGDLDKGHMAELVLDIKNRGLEQNPIIELNQQTGLYNIISGHHRSESIRIILEELKLPIKIPCTIVEFKDSIDKELFMQSENSHAPVKSHTKKDAIRFIKRMREEGWFDSANGEENKIRSMCFALLGKHYPRIADKTKEEVLSQAFKDKEITRVLTILKSDLKEKIKDLFPQTKPFSWNGNSYLCWGSTDNSRKSVAVGLEKRVKDIESGKVNFVGGKGKITVVTYFSSDSIDDLDQQRIQFIETERLMNKYAYGPGGVVLISEVVFMPQKDGKKGIKENKPLRYKWDYEEQNFFEIK